MTAEATRVRVAIIFLQTVRIGRIALDLDAQAGDSGPFAEYDMFRSIFKFIDQIPIDSESGLKSNRAGTSHPGFWK